MMFDVSFGEWIEYVESEVEVIMMLIEKKQQENAALVVENWSRRRARTKPL